ncbi:WYL domain-containing protein [Psychromonas sp. KJ10-2]|uniref:WYL domain-containing protein n=1 Tax=Psychromonas sp. KJ10-2 TaxID=3391822 RepID=UPI0039B65C0E
MDVLQLDSLTHAQKERLAFIDFSLQYFGQVARADLIQHFKTGLAACTRDLTAYRELAPKNLKLFHQTKNYHRTDTFEPIFEHNPEAILTGLCRGFGDGLSNGIQASEHCVDATRLVHPKSEVIATLMRAINSQQAVACEYVSLSSGRSKREIVPHAIVNNGHRWHVRAFDRKSQEFRDFVCTRLQKVSEMKQHAVSNRESIALDSHELRASDRQWNKIVKIILKPHPSIKYKQAIELDYGMTNGESNLEVRASILGYLLRQWNVDCTNDASLQGKEYQLWLSNVSHVNKELANIANLAIAPGYKQI